VNAGGLQSEDTQPGQNNAIPYLKNTESKKDWECGSSGTVHVKKE
jgi:hypothetical protein